MSPGTFNNKLPISSPRNQKNINLPTKKFCSPRIDRLNREFEARMSPDFIPSYSPTKNKYSEVINRYRDYISKVREKLSKRTVIKETDRLEEMMF